MPCPGWAFPQPCKNFIPYVDDLPDLESSPFHESPQNGNATPRGGFLHHRIQVNPDGTSTAPSQLPNAQGKQRIYRNLAKASGKISFDRETSRDRASACVLNVQGTARRTDRRGHQSGPSPSFNDEKGHAKASPGWRCWQPNADSPRWHMERMPMIQRICGRVVLWLEECEGGVADQAVRFGGRLMLTEALNIQQISQRASLSL